MASINKVIEAAYLSGKSIPDLEGEFGIPRSTLHHRLKKAGLLRNRSDAVRLAKPKLGSGFRGKRRTFTHAHRQAIKASAIARGIETSVGLSKKADGYVEYTRGENKGRSVHVVIMEERIGRRIRDDECVHHVDGNPSNNEIDNLALMTRAAHALLHVRERLIAKGEIK